MAEETILNIMVAHHALLESFFGIFATEAKKKSLRASEYLTELVWEMKKHFFAEESAIFDFPPLKIMGVWEIVKQLKKEHVIMLEDLREFLENPEAIKDEAVNDFHSLLENHRKIEELNLYPRLDSGMQEDQKRLVISRINEIPINK